MGGKSLFLFSFSVALPVGVVETTVTLAIAHFVYLHKKITSLSIFEYTKKRLSVIISIGIYSADNRICVLFNFKVPVLVALELFNFSDII